MRKTFIAAVLAAAVAAPLAAQQTPAPAPAATPAAGAAAQPRPGGTPEDIARGSVIFRTFSVAINSDKVPAAVKSRLAACMYNTPMRAISVATGNVFAKNSNLDPKNPQQVYAVAARVCGVQPAQASQQQGAAAPAQAPAPAPAASR